MELQPTPQPGKGNQHLNHCNRASLVTVAASVPLRAASTCRYVPPSRTAPPPPSPVRQAVRQRVLLGWRVVAGWLSARTAWKAET